MSAFLGKIHYWLYGKITLHEGLINEMAALDSNNGQRLVEESVQKYGQPVTGALENEIDHGNIHGWLQQRIESVESRLAYVATGLLKEGNLNREALEKVFYRNGAEAMGKLSAQQASPQELYQMIFDHMLEGMPCDHVNEILENEETKLVWKTTRDLHKKFWDAANSDVGIWHDLKNAWIGGFLGASEAGCRYTGFVDGINTIERV